MVRPLRIEFPGAWYHVMNRGLARREIFRSDIDRKFFLSFLRESAEVYRIEVHAYSLMDNHYHLLIRTPSGGLSRAMRHLNGIYTQKVNKRWGTDGPLFRGRYKALLVDSEEYLLEVFRYIHLNPVEAGICSRPDKHPWTSHRSYLLKRYRPSWLVTQEILSRFDVAEGRALWKMDRFVNEGVPQGFKDFLRKQRLIVGGSGFRDWVYENIAKWQKNRKGIALQDSQPRPKVPIKTVLSRISHAYDVSMQDIRRVQSGMRNDARSMAVYLTRNLTGAPQKEIARWFRLENEFAVAKSNQRFRERLAEDRKLQRMTKTLTNSILSTVTP